jgi:iron complex transport system ATP-binding protein
VGPPWPDGPWLEISGLGFSHGPRRVVRDLTLAMRPGRHYVVAGPNGAGKSTLMDLLARLRRPESGRIALMGRDLAGYSPRDLARVISLAPQSSRFDFAFTVREVVRLGRRPYLGRWGRLGPGDEAVVEEAIDRLHLGALAGKPVTALSGGEAQRVVLARTLAQATPVVLLDEPTASLDVAQALDLMGTLTGLAERGALVVTVTHDLGLAAAYADEMVLMRDGALVAAGPKDSTLTAELLERVFEAEAQVRVDPFTGGLALSFRPAGNRPGAGPGG